MDVNAGSGERKVNWGSEFVTLLAGVRAQPWWVVGLVVVIAVVAGGALFAQLPSGSAGVAPTATFGGASVNATIQGSPDNAEAPVRVPEQSADITLHLEAVVVDDEISPDILARDGHCRGDDPFSDVRPGGSITVYGPSGQIIGVGELTRGVVNADITRCTMYGTVQVPSVPFYRVQFGQENKIVFSRAQLVNESRDAVFTN